MNILRKNRKSNYKYNRKVFVRVMLFIFSLIFATFAWVTYTNILDDVLNFHMVSWDLQYYLDSNSNGTLETTGANSDTEITNPLSISVPVLYPQMSSGLNNYITRDVFIKNNGDAIIDLSYDINSIEILGKNYAKANNYEIEIPGDPPTTESITPGNITIASNVSTQDLLNDSEKYPFKIEIISDTVVQGESNAKISIRISWDPETRNDELDTIWGHDVAKYMQEHNDSPIKIVLQVNAIQSENQ